MTMKKKLFTKNECDEIILFSENKILCVFIKMEKLLCSIVNSKINKITPIYMHI